MRNHHVSNNQPMTLTSEETNLILNKILPAATELLDERKRLSGIVKTELGLLGASFLSNQNKDPSNQAALSAYLKHIIIDLRAALTTTPGNQKPKTKDEVCKDLKAALSWMSYPSKNQHEESPFSEVAYKKSMYRTKQLRLLLRTHLLTTLSDQEAKLLGPISFKLLQSLRQLYNCENINQNIIESNPLLKLLLQNKIHPYSLKSIIAEEGFFHQYEFLNVLVEKFIKELRATKSTTEKNKIRQLITEFKSALNNIELIVSKDLAASPFLDYLDQKASSNSATPSGAKNSAMESDTEFLARMKQVLKDTGVSASPPRVKTASQPPSSSNDPSLGANSLPSKPSLIGRTARWLLRSTAATLDLSLTIAGGVAGYLGGAEINKQFDLQEEAKNLNLTLSTIAPALIVNTLIYRLKTYVVAEVNSGDDSELDCEFSEESLKTIDRKKI